MQMMLKKTMIKTIKKFAKVFFVVDFALVLFCLISANMAWLINSQVAFISSLFISIATFLSYRNNVQKRLENEDHSIDTLDDRDQIDEIDDPFDLYSEDEPIIEEKELTVNEIKTIIKDEKSKIKQHTVKNLFKSSLSFVSLYRIAGYAILVLGFFYLVNNKLFEPFSYMVGLFIVPLSLLLSKLISKSETILEEEDQ